MAERRGPDHKVVRRWKKILQDDPKVVAEEHVEWMLRGGLHQHQKDFSAAPIAKLYGMPYRPPISPQEVARLRGNSHGDGSTEPQDEEP